MQAYNRKNEQAYVNGNGNKSYAVEDDITSSQQAIFYVL